MRRHRHGVEWTRYWLTLLEHNGLPWAVPLALGFKAWVGPMGIHEMESNTNNGYDSWYIMDTMLWKYQDIKVTCVYVSHRQVHYSHKECEKYLIRCIIHMACGTKNLLRELYDTSYEGSNPRFMLKKIRTPFSTLSTLSLLDIPIKSLNTDEPLKLEWPLIFAYAQMAHLQNNRVSLTRRMTGLRDFSHI